MASRRELEALIVLSGRINPTLQNALRQTQRGIGGIGSSSNLMGKVVNKSFELAAKAAAMGTAAVGAGLAYIGVKGTMLASDLTEVQNVVDTTFGKSSKVIDEWSVTTLKSFGLSELSAKQFSSTIGAMLKSSGLSAESTLIMSKNLTALSGDMASFYNLDPTEAFEKIRSGISGETEPLKQLGINMSVANLEAYAMANGIKTSYQKMDQASQTALRYNYLLSVSKDAQGDFAKTSGSFSNQLKLGKESLGQLAAKIMSAAVPGLTKLLNLGNELLDGAMGNPQFIKTFQDTMSSGMDKLIALLPSIQSGFQTASEYVKLFYDIGVDTFNFIKNNWGLIEPIIWGMVAAQLAFNVAAKAAMIIQIVSGAYAAANTMIRMYRVGMGLATVAQWALNAAWTANPIGIVIVAIGLLVAAGVWLYQNWDTVKIKFSETWTAIKDSFLTSINWIIDKYNSFLRLLNKIPGINIPMLATFETSTMKAQTLQEGRGSIPEFATGGFTNQPSIFGEAGPEAAIPLKYKNPRSLSILNKTAKAIGADSDKGRGQIQLIYSPTITGGSNSDIESKLKSQAEEFKAWLEDYFAEQGRLSFD
jgi:hypothetical protein